MGDGGFPDTVGFTGEEIITTALHWAEKTAVPPIHTITWEMHFIIHGHADAHNAPDLALAVRYRIMNPDMLTSVQSEKVAGMLVVPSCNILSMGSCATVVFLNPSLLLLGVGLRVSRYNKF